MFLFTYFPRIRQNVPGSEHCNAAHANQYTTIKLIHTPTVYLSKVASAKFTSHINNIHIDLNHPQTYS